MQLMLESMDAAYRSATASSPGENSYREQAGMLECFDVLQVDLKGDGWSALLEQRILASIDHPEPGKMEPSVRDWGRRQCGRQGKRCEQDT